MRFPEDSGDPHEGAGKALPRPILPLAFITVSTLDTRLPISYHTYMINQRQGEILRRTVEEYIDSAQPVSSKLLEKKYDFGICPATIRSEMQKLTDQGLLSQPYTSSGRVPTDKGYRFFVDSLFGQKDSADDFQIDEWFDGEVKDTVKFIQSLTRNLASASQALVFNHLKNEKIFWKDGWEEILKEPEFQEKKYLVNFVDFLRNFEKNIEEFEASGGVKIYIGKESPLPKASDFSIISSRYFIPEEKEEGFLAIIGPKRMHYDRNIGIVNSLIKLLEDF